MYEPVRLIDGRTSDVTHFLNFLACGLSDLKMRENRPDSLTISIDWVPRRVSAGAIPFSSSSRRLATSEGFLMSSTQQASASTNHFPPLISILRDCNSDPHCHISISHRII